MCENLNRMRGELVEAQNKLKCSVVKSRIKVIYVTRHLTTAIGLVAEIKNDNREVQNKIHLLNNMLMVMKDYFDSPFIPPYIKCKDKGRHFKVALKRLADVEIEEANHGV
jgi:hypothetical protein